MIFPLRMLICFILLFLVSCASSTDHWILAKQEWSNNDYLGSIIELNTCISQQQQTDSIYLLRARNYHKIQNDSQAIADYTRALRFNPNNGDARLERARLQLQKGDTLNAGISLRLLIKNPSARIVSDSWIEIGRMQYFADHFSAAITAMNQAVQHDSTNHMAWYYRGLLFSRFFTPEGETRAARYPFLDFPAAINDFSQCIQRQPNFADAWYQRAVVWFNLFNENKGMPDINEAIRLEPKYSYYYAARAHQHAASGRLQAALHDYTTSISLNQQDPDAFLGRANVLEKLGRNNEALSDRKAASSIPPTKN
jgi:tetratricopeptide (TPR) repeat protein